MHWSRRWYGAWRRPGAWITPGGARWSWLSRREAELDILPSRRRATPCATASRTPWSGAASPWRKARRRPLFYLGVLATGFVLAASSTRCCGASCRRDRAKEIFTLSVTPTLGPVTWTCWWCRSLSGRSGSMCPLLALVGVAIAYYVARSIF